MRNIHHVLDVHDVKSLQQFLDRYIDKGVAILFLCLQTTATVLVLEGVEVRGCVIDTSPLILMKRAYSKRLASFPEPEQQFQSNHCI